MMEKLICALMAIGFPLWGPFWQLGIWRPFSQIELAVVGSFCGLIVIVALVFFGIYLSEHMTIVWS